MNLSYIGHAKGQCNLISFVLRISALYVNRTLPVALDDNERVKQPKLEYSTPNSADLACLLISKIQASESQPQAPTPQPKAVALSLESQLVLFNRFYKKTPRIIHTSAK